MIHLHLKSNPNHMKVSALVLVFFIVLSTFSCNDDAVPSDPIVGTWIVTNFTTSECPDEDDNGTEYLTCNSTYCNKLTFTGDGKWKQTFTGSGSTITENGTYKLNSNEIETCNNNGTNCSTREFQLIDDNKKLIVTASREDGCIAEVRYRKD